jgi:hypothetical protein
MNKKYKIRLLFKGGGMLIIKCKSYKIDKLTDDKDQRSLLITNADRRWTIDLDELVGFTAKKVWF